MGEKEGGGKGGREEGREGGREGGKEGGRKNQELTLMSVSLRRVAWVMASTVQ